MAVNYFGAGIELDHCRWLSSSAVTYLILSDTAVHRMCHRTPERVACDSHDRNHSMPQSLENLTRPDIISAHHVDVAHTVMLRYHKSNKKNTPIRVLRNWSRSVNRLVLVVVVTFMHTAELICAGLHSGLYRRQQLFTLRLWNTSRPSTSTVIRNARPDEHERHCNGARQHGKKM